MNLNLCAETGCKRRCMPLKYLLVMKLIFLLTTIACLQVSARTAAQSISLSKTDAPLTEVFNSIKQQSNYKFFWKGDDLSKFKVTVSLKNANINETMDKVLKDLPLTYSITANTIVIREKEPTLLDKLKAALTPPQYVRGRVTNKQGEFLANATVLLKRTNGGTLTDAGGKFTVNGVLASDTLIISFIGYQKQVIAIGNRQYIDVVLQETTNSLDQVVVQAYGETSQRLTTGDIGKLTAADIEKQPVTNVLEALEGKITGLDVKQTNGFASAPYKVELRGRSSISSAFVSDPLYVIDGVPLTIVESTNGTGNAYYNGSPGFLQNDFKGPANGQSPLFSLNPSDIQSIEVLKDAAATAIYGSRGANGVILIITKKGRPGKTKLDLHVQEGVTKVTRYWDMLNTPQYLEMRHQAFVNDGATPNPGNAYDLLSWDTTRYTNWQKALYGNTGRAFDGQAAVSGGDEQTTFRLGMGYNRTTDITTASGADERSSISLNVVHHSQDHRFTAAITAQYAYTKSDMINLPSAVTLAPNAPAIYDAQGNLNYAGWGGSDDNPAARRAYPFASLMQPYTSKTNFLNSNLLLSYQLIKNLQLSANLGYNTSQANQVQFLPIASLDPTLNPFGSANWGYNNNKNVIAEPQLNYNAFIGKGKINVLLGGSIQQTNTDGLFVQGTGYTDDELLGTLSNAPNLTTSQNIGEYKYAAAFSRISYNWEDKYIVDFSGRRDGSSRFGPGKQYGNFGAVGAGWIFTNENFIKDHLPFLSFGKIRASYGITGSDGVGDYQYLSQYSSQNTYPYNGISPLLPIIEANPTFQWQTNKKLEGAVNLGFLSDRITIQVAYYNNRCGNQLVGFPLPAITGFASVTANSPALVENKGWEFTALAKIIDGKKFNWSMNFNMSINRNKLVSYPNFDMSPFVSTEMIGEPLTIVRVLHYTGVDPATGHYTFEDKNHDGKITYDYSHQSSDDTYPLDLTPKFFGGLGTNFSYQSLQLSLYFSFKKQLGKNAYFGVGQAGSQNQNAPVGVLSRWQKPGDVQPFAAFTESPSDASYLNFSQFSDGVYTDASFIRLSNVAISYALPESWVQKAHVRGCTLFLHANNLFVITKYKGIDPETQNFGGLPPTRTIVAGLSFNF